jgi:hypothetical protein
VGEKEKQPFQLSFNSSLKVDFQGSRVTSDGGLVLVRELDEHLGFGELIERLWLPKTPPARVFPVVRREIPCSGEIIPCSRFKIPSSVG